MTFFDSSCLKSILHQAGYAAMCISNMKNRKQNTKPIERYFSFKASFNGTSMLIHFMKLQFLTRRDPKEIHPCAVWRNK